ncbi:MAG: hypothetical protein ACO1OT_07265, partial [Heyndrickxia sp.]
QYSFFHKRKLEIIATKQYNMPNAKAKVKIICPPIAVELYSKIDNSRSINPIIMYKKQKAFLLFVNR